MNDEKPTQDNSFKGNDPRFVDHDSPGERAYWCKALGVSETELYAAVAAVGNSAQRVKDWLRARGAPSTGESPQDNGD